MALNQRIVGQGIILLLCIICLTYAVDTNQVDILKRITKLEAVQLRCDLKNSVLEEQVRILVEKNDDLEKKYHELKEVQTEAQKEGSKTTVNDVPLPSIHRRQSGSSNVAFSTYLDHDVDNLGPNQVIVFNQVQLNDGNGYSDQTGAFTVPISGVYVFTFFIGERDPNQLYVKLVVNGASKSDAVAETVANSHDAQGGNVVVLKVNKNDAVMIEHNTWGSHIEGYPDIRLSTFSGFLLYPIEEGFNVVGK